MKRRLRIRFALLSAFAIVFAQIAVAAQPWPPGAAEHQHHAVVAAAAAADAAEHCQRRADGETALPQTPAPSPNFCEVHCQDAAQPDALIVAAGAPLPQPGLLVPLAEATVVRDTDAAPLEAKCASPPARLLFARFLI